MIWVLRMTIVRSDFWCINAMTMTTGKRFTDRTKDHSEQRILDARTCTVLNALVRLPKSKTFLGTLHVSRCLLR